MKKLILSFFLIAALFSFNKLSAQCQETTISGNLTILNDTILSGKYTISGTFHVISGVSVFVQTYGFGNCGKLEIYANKIIIEGAINGNFSGYTGGAGGAGGSIVTSITGDANGLTACSNKDNAGHIVVQGGQAGLAGNGPGAGQAGTSGSNGAGTKQQCQSTSDEAGVVGGAGGAGGGGGAAYGGNGSTSANGGAGANTYQNQGLNVSSAYSIVGGIAGMGGANGSVYGTNNGLDIDLGSGGAGGGGGGRSFAAGTQGGNGGAGGAMILLEANDSLIITGTVTANGENGQAGGNGGNGGESPKCCSDGCDDCGEATLSAGAGAGAGGGGGSGGGIFLKSNTFALINGNLSATGGNGGSTGNKGNGASCNYGGNWACSANSLTTDAGSFGGDGGAGGGGRIKIAIPVCNMGEINPQVTIQGGTGASIAEDGSYFLICSPLSIESLGAKYFDFDVFPNPAYDNINIRFVNSGISYQNASIEIFDMNGRIILQENCTLQEQSTQQLNINELNKGIYLIRLQADEHQLLKKFIKN
jgi:hypothetical protein